MYYTYMLRCEDNSIYTGITVDIKRRFKEHIEKDKKCAKYTATHQVTKLEIVWESENKSLASKLEFYIKKLTKSDKEKLIIDKKLENFLSDKIETEKYKILKDTEILL